MKDGTVGYTFPLAAVGTAALLLLRAISANTITNVANFKLLCIFNFQLPICLLHSGSLDDSDFVPLKVCGQFPNVRVTSRGLFHL